MFLVGWNFSCYHSIGFHSKNSFKFFVVCFRAQDIAYLCIYSVGTWKEYVFCSFGGYCSIINVSQSPLVDHDIFLYSLAKFLSCSISCWDRVLKSPNCGFVSWTLNQELKIKLWNWNILNDKKYIFYPKCKVCFILSSSHDRIEGFLRQAFW